MGKAAFAARTNHSMERIEFALDGPSLIVPARGCSLLVRFKPAGQETDAVFCDYGARSGPSLQLFNCRTKALLFAGTVPCDYALKVGTVAFAAESVVDIFQMPTPAWFHRLEVDALAFARQSQTLAQEIGLADFFRALTRSP